MKEYLIIHNHKHGIDLYKFLANKNAFKNGITLAQKRKICKVLEIDFDYGYEFLELIEPDNKEIPKIIFRTKTKKR